MANSAADMVGRGRIDNRPTRTRPDGALAQGRRGRAWQAGLIAVIGLLALMLLASAQASVPRFDPQPNEAVLTLLNDRDRERILVGGRFTNFDGHERTYLLALDNEGQVDQHLVPALMPDGGEVRAVAVRHDGKIYIGGRFTPQGESGGMQTGLARLNEDGSLDEAFPLLEFDAEVNAIALMDDDSLLVGGHFTHVAHQPRGRIVRLMENGDIDESFELSFDGGEEWVQSMSRLPDGRVYITGNFANVGKHNAGHLLRMHPHGEPDQDFHLQFDGVVNVVFGSDHDPRPIVGGAFSQVGEYARSRLARLHDHGEPDDGFDPPGGVSGNQVWALASDMQQRLLVAGDFTGLAGEPRTHLARLQGEGGDEGQVDLTFAPELDGPVTSVVARSDGSVLIAGPFTQVNGQARGGIALLDEFGQVVGPPPGLLLPPMHDTGQVQCYADDGAVIPCNQPTHPAQDGQYGRDRAAVDGALVKVGGGTGGFDFTKIANNGSDLSENASLGFGSTDWACTRDNVTGLMWEVKIDDPTFGPGGNARHYGWSFHWYNTDATHNGGDEGFGDSGASLACGFTIDCNTQAFVDYLNSIQLCGRTDWRIPSLPEMQNVVNYGSSFFTGGAMDRVYFADGGGYSGYGGGWTNDTDVDHNGHHAWAVNFDDGHAENHPKGGLQPIRAVAGTLHELTGPAPACGKQENLLIRPSTAGAFTIQGQLAHDARTGLIWDRCSLGQEFHSGDGSTYCDGVSPAVTWAQAHHEVKARNAAHYLGYNDWRLPNIKEMTSLHERRCAQPSLDTRVFPTPDIEPHWTSTTSAYHPPVAFAIQFEFNHQLSVPKDGPWGRVRLVRGGPPHGDHVGTPAYEVAGTLTGLIGADLRLRLQGGGVVDETLVLDADGRFAFTNGLADGASYTVAVAQAPFPHQLCTVTAGASGTVAGADIANVAVACADPAPAVIDVSHQALDFALPEGATIAETMTIGNTGGGFLDWSIDTAYAAGATVVRGGTTCSSGSSLLRNDDGTAENAYGGNAFWEGDVAIVDRFTPASYPASIQSVCLGLTGTNGQTSMAITVVVFDDNGPGGTPGTELAALPVLATGLPQWPVTTPTWFQVDLSSLYTTVDSGTLYVGLRWKPLNPQHFFALVDQTNDRPLGHAGGYYWNHGIAPGQWTTLQTVFTEYRAMMIRAIQGGGQEPPTGCDAPSNVPWLSLTPASGRTPEGLSTPVEVSVNTAGVAAGDYSALLCIQHNDPSQPLIQVPVSLRLFSSPGVLTATPSELDFGAVAMGDTSAALTVTLASDGAGPAPNIMVDSVSAPFERTGGSCPSGVFTLEANQSCTVQYQFTPPQLGVFAQTVGVDGPFNATSFALHGAGVPGAPTSLNLLSGSGQQTTVGTPFPLPLAVLVKDAFGHPVPGVLVRFLTPPSGPSAQVLPSQAHTDGNGYAQAVVTANAQAGAYHVIALVEGTGINASFVLHNLATRTDASVQLHGSRDHARPGQVVDYIVTVQNNGPDAANGVAVVSELSDQFDLAATSWICVGPSNSGCTASGQGNLFDEGLNLPSGGQVTYLLSSPLRHDADGEAFSRVLVELTGDSDPGNDEAGDSVTLVIHRDGFERYGDGASGETEISHWQTPVQGWFSSAVRAFPYVGVATILEAVAANGEAFVLDRFEEAGTQWLRMSTWRNGGVIQASPWLPVAAGQAIGIHFDAVANDCVADARCAVVRLWANEVELLSQPLASRSFQVRTTAGVIERDQH